MKIVKNYHKFSEEYRLNENLLTKAWDKVVEFFKSRFGKHAWIHYAVYLKKSNQLPSDQVDLICPPSYLVKRQPTADEIEDSLSDTYSERLVKEGMNDDEGYVPLDAADLNMENVNVKQLKESILQIYKMNFGRAGRHEEEGYGIKSKHKRKKTHAIFIWGAPGIGKTEILHQLAKELDIAVLEWHLATLEPTDFRGIPKVVNDRTVSRLPSIFPTSDGENGKGGIMFFDELNRAPGMVLSAALSLALSGKHGDYEIPPRWIIMAAGNRPEDITGKLTDDAILWNRFFHVNYVPTLDEWFDYIKTLPHINPDLIDFIKANPKFYHRLAQFDTPPNWPSPRTWEMASEEEYFERAENWNNRLPISELQDIYQDLVGHDAAVAFAKFVEKLEEKRRLERIEKEKKDREKLGKGKQSMNPMDKEYRDEIEPDELDIDNLDINKDQVAKKTTKKTK